MEKHKKPAQVYPERAFINNPGGFLLSHAVARAVPSAPRGLTSVFGMGTGVTLSTQPPENLFKFGLRNSNQKSEMKRTFSVAGAQSSRAIARTANRPKSALRNLFEI